MGEAFELAVEQEMFPDFRTIVKDGRMELKRLPYKDIQREWSTNKLLEVQAKLTTRQWVEEFDKVTTTPQFTADQFYAELRERRRVIEQMREASK